MDLNKLVEENAIWKFKQVGTVSHVHADNMMFLRWCKENAMFKHFHVGIVDPPFGIDVTKMKLGGNKDTVRNYERGEWDGEVPTQEYWDLLWYCCRNLIIWGGNYFTDKYGCVVRNGKPDPITPGRCFLYWDKDRDKTMFGSGELALTTFDKNCMAVRRTTNKGGDDETDKRHDTQKPVYLYDFLHLNFVERGHRVLDTHGGSFNHGVAALKTNTNLIIMDKFEPYYYSGMAAYEKMYSKPRLF